jgi:hypothetical protein
MQITMKILRRITSEKADISYVWRREQFWWQGWHMFLRTIQVTNKPRPHYTSFSFEKSHSQDEILIKTFRDEFHTNREPASSSFTMHTNWVCLKTCVADPDPDPVGSGPFCSDPDPGLKNDPILTFWYV